MKNTKTISVLAVCLLAAVLLACNATTANISSLKLAKDKDGKSAATEFKAGDTVYGFAQIGNNGGKVKVNFRMVAENVKDMKAGEVVKGSEASVDVEGDGAATCTLSTSPGTPAGTYKLVAEMIYNGEKKDEKSSTFTLTGGAPTAPTEKKEPEEKTEDGGN